MDTLVKLFLYVIVLPVCLMVTIPASIYFWQEYQRYLAHQDFRRRHEEEEQRKRDELEKRTSKTFPTPDDFIATFAEILEAELDRAGIELPTRQLMRELLRTARALYTRELPARPSDTANLEQYAAQLEKFDARLAAEALALCFVNLLRNISHDEAGQFSVTVGSVTGKQTLIDIVVKPFYQLKDVKERRLFQYIRDHYHQGAMTAARRQKRRDDDLVWPHEYEGEDVHDLYLVPELARLFKQTIPFKLADRTRFDSHHVIGKKDSGKSTLLSHMIAYDIGRIPAVSAMVIDSQYRMIDGFARLPGLHPVFIGPDHPIALNPFRWGNIDDVVDILTYAFGSIFETSLTELQAGTTEYIIRAVAQHLTGPH